MSCRTALRPHWGRLGFPLPILGLTDASNGLPRADPGLATRKDLFTVGADREALITASPPPPTGAAAAGRDGGPKPQPMGRGRLWKNRGHLYTVILMDALLRLSRIGLRRLLLFCPPISGPFPGLRLTCLCVGVPHSRTRPGTSHCPREVFALLRASQPVGRRRPVPLPVRPQLRCGMRPLGACAHRVLGTTVV